jgi:hypothetical protein
MSSFRKLSVAAAISSTLALTGCSSSDGGGGSNGGGSSGGTVSGTASAPYGEVAHFQTRNLFEIAAEFFISPAAAAVFGLDPIEGADVELIRVDDEGNQVGDVLASTTTSTTGEYRLPLPQGVNLAGNLIVRITGTNNQSLRAQVVEQEVDISPVSEFVLRKFIETGADLDQLQVNDVVKLSGKVEEFDMTAGQNLSQMFDILEQEVGEFVENEVAVAAGGKGDAGAIEGEYRSVAFALELYDQDNNDSGTYAHSLWASTFSFNDGGEDIVGITLGDEEDVYGSYYGLSVGSADWLNHEVEMENVDDTFNGKLTQSGILAIEGEFEEEIGDEEGWRWPAITYNLVQIADKGLFIVQPNEAAVRYGLIDTDSDGEPDALDPDTKLGDEISRSIEFFARQPLNFTDSDLTGTFGRVYISSELNTANINLKTEVNTLTFGGDGTFDYSEVTSDHGHHISLSQNGPTYLAMTDPANTDVPVVISANGDITEIDGVAADGFINDTMDFIAVYGSEGESMNVAQSGAYSMVDLTLMAKLPITAPSVANKRFRMQLISMKLDSEERFLLSSSKFNTFLAMSSETAGTIDGGFLEVEKNGLAGQVSVTTDKVEAAPVTATIDTNGATTITIDSTEGTTTLDGFFNEDASMGLFALRWAPTNGDPDELGLVVLTTME